MAVEIVGDTARLLERAKFDFVVAAVPDYVPAVQLIKGAVAAGKPLRVMVRDAACAVWLERFAASYRNMVVRYTVTSARDLLAERWQTEIPDRVTDEAILASGFLEQDVVPRAGQSYDEIVMEHYWGEFFTFVRFPMTLAGELIGSLDPERWRANRERPLAVQALQARRERWLDQAPQREFKKLIQSVFDNPAQIRDMLGRYKLLRGYSPQISESVLGEWYTLFGELKVDPTPVELGSVDLGKTIQEIQYYLNGLTVRITGIADLEAALGEMSGWLPEELDWTVQLLRDRGEELQPTPELLQQIAAKFESIREQVEPQLAALEIVVPPPRPIDPAEKAEVQDWLDWAVREYLPYRFWLEENNRWDEAVAGYATKYADWFYDQYITNKFQHQDRWVFDLLNRAATGLTAGRKVLFLLLDNFNHKYLHSLLGQFSQKGFRLVGKSEPVWSPIPTSTDVSKWCLVAGAMELGKVQGRGYEDILDKDWKGHYGQYEVTYMPQLSDLEKRRQFNEDLILLNFLPIDRVLHKDEREIASTHTAEIQRYIQNLVQVVAQFAQRAGVEQELDILIASDHGSTKVPAKIGNALDDKFYQKQATSRHHRYIAVLENRAVNPTAYDEAHCYIVRADMHGTLENYFIARDYDRFIPTQQDIYIHGGLTPEETIVPFCKLAKVEIRVRQPDIRLTENIVRYSVKTDLVFVVGNPNDHPITNVELRVLESDLPGVSSEAIPAGISKEIAIPVRIKRRPGVPTLEAITVEGSFEMQGQRFPIEQVRLSVESRSLMETKTDFDF